MNSNFPAPFGTCPALRATIVPRWAIIKMARTQSVAEHSFNVAMITRAILSNFIKDQLDDNAIIVKALDHDWKDEIYTGDIPSPAKPVNIPLAQEDRIIKLADVIEAYIFARQNCSDSNSVRNWVLAGLQANINGLAASLGIDNIWLFICNIGGIDE
jgi:hypothetical protein